MTQTSGEQRNRGLAALWCGLPAAVLVLAGGAVRAEPSPAAAWAFDLLARVEQGRLTPPLDIVRGVAEERAVPAAAQARLQAGYGRLPMRFEPNVGQTADEVKFVARGPGYTLFLTADEAVLALRPSRPAAERAEPGWRRQSFALENVARQAAAPGAVLRIRLEGATRNPAPQPEGLEKLPGASNYFLGNDPAKWRTNVPHYARVRYPEAYPGIDLVYYGNPQRLEHDFVVAPGADPSVIRLAISGAGGATVDADGGLVLKVPGGEVVQQAPTIYQIIDGRPRAVAGRYVLRDAAPGAPQTATIAAAESVPEPLRIGLEVARYDRSQPLVIDPVLAYSTYLGGSGGDSGRGIAVDGAGNAYVTGSTSSTDFPTANARDSHLKGPNDAFVVKLSGDGRTVLYSTYLGGSSWDDIGFGIAVDGAGNAYVTGSTSSTDFPTANALGPDCGDVIDLDRDAFVVKLSGDGQTLLYSTCLGGSRVDDGLGIAVDGAGNAYVTGYTDYPGLMFPMNNFFKGRGSNGFVVKLSGDGQTALYSTYLGGERGDSGHGIAVDGAGNAYVTGYTNSTDFAYACSDSESANAFVAKLSGDGQTVLYSTCLSGSNSDYGSGIAVDGAGNAYVTGSTQSADFPAVNARYPRSGGRVDAFVAKLSGDGQTVLYSTYLGGSDVDYGLGIAVDGAGNAYVTGYAGSADFPAANACYRRSSEESPDAFVAKLSGDGQTVLYSTCLSGSNSDYGSGIAVDGAGNAYVTGHTSSTDFPTANARDSHLKGSDDAFVVKFENEPSFTLAVTVAGPGSGRVASSPAGIDCGAICVADFDGGTTASLTATPAAGSTFAGWAPASCGSPFTLIADITCTATFDLANRPPVAEAGPARTVECAGPSGSSVTLDGSGSSDPDGDPLTFVWTGPFGTQSGASIQPTIPLGAHGITLEVADRKGGTASDTVTVTVRDTTPPTLGVVLSPDRLWPPNQKMSTVTADVQASDTCDPQPTVTLVSIISSEPENGLGDGNTANDIQNATFGTDDRTFALRAERSGPGTGRIYTATYQARDRSGNTSTTTARVVVPHDQRK